MNSKKFYFSNHLKLVASNTTGPEVYPNEGLAIPTAGKANFIHNAKRAPAFGVDTNGKNVLPKSKTRPQFLRVFQIANIRGYRRNAYLTLNLDDKKVTGRTLLLLTGGRLTTFSFGEPSPLLKAAEV
jgi:hypothetical protein